MYLCILYGPVSGHTGEIDGGFAGGFMRMGLGAKALGQGGAYTAVAEDGYAMYYNPAGLPHLMNRMIHVTNTILSLDRQLYFAGYAQSIQPSGGIGIGILRTGVDNLVERNSSGQRLGSIAYSENAVLFSFALQIDRRISIGMTGKYLYHELHTITSKTFGADVGILIHLNRNVTFGVVAQDLGSKYNWNSNAIYERGASTTDTFPVVLRAGAAYTLTQYPIRIAAEIHKWKYSDALPHAGIEYTYRSQYKFRAGLINLQPSLGFGLSYPVLQKTFHFDFATYSLEHDPEWIQVISAAFDF